MKKGINRKLTSKYILSKVSQEEIFSKYLGIDIGIIRTAIETGRLINSPLRIDKHPSFGFKYDRYGKLKARDFAGYFWGDCFDIVGYRINENPNKAKGFYNILNHICKTFNIDYDTKDIEYKPIDYSIEKSIIKVAYRDWNTFDLEFWNNYSIDINILREYNVNPILTAFINKYGKDKPIYHFDIKDPCYCYYLGTDSKLIDNVELYFPYRGLIGKPKFICNTGVIKGLLQCNFKDILLITKSYKDIMCLKSILNIIDIGFNIDVISLSSETRILTEQQYNFLKEKYSSIYSLLDFDKTGVSASNRMSKLYNIKPLFLTNGRFGTINYGAKDFSDYVKNNGFEKALNLVNEILKIML